MKFMLTKISNYQSGSSIMQLGCFNMQSEFQPAFSSAREMRINSISLHIRGTLCAIFDEQKIARIDTEIENKEEKRNMKYRRFLKSRNIQTADGIIAGCSFRNISRWNDAASPLLQAATASSCCLWQLELRNHEGYVA